MSATLPSTSQNSSEVSEPDRPSTPLFERDDDTATLTDLITLLQLSFQHSDKYKEARTVFLDRTDPIEVDKIAGLLWRQPVTHEGRRAAAAVLLGDGGGVAYTLLTDKASVWTEEVLDGFVKELWDGIENIVNPPTLFVRRAFIEVLLDDYTTEANTNYGEFVQRRSEPVPDWRRETAREIATREERLRLGPGRCEAVQYDLPYPGVEDPKVGLGKLSP